MNIKLRVANLVAKSGTTNPYHIANDLGIDILPFGLPPSIRGFLVRVLRRKIIMVNDSLDDTAQMVTICHEIGHARLHSGYGYYYHTDGTHYVPSKREREANEFALHLLSYSHDFDVDAWASTLSDKRPDPNVVHRILNELCC